MTFLTSNDTVQKNGTRDQDKMFDQVFQLYGLLDNIRKSYSEDSFYHSVNIEDFYSLHVLSFRDALNNSELTAEDIRSFTHRVLKDKSRECIKNNLCNDRFFYNSHEVTDFAMRYAR